MEQDTIRKQADQFKEAWTESGGDWEKFNSITQENFMKELGEELNALRGVIFEKEQEMFEDFKNEVTRLAREKLGMNKRK